MGREARLRRAQRTEQRSQQVTLPMGPAGLMEFMTFVGATDDGPLHDPQGSRGQYSAVLTLSRPGIRPLGEYEQTPSEALEGDSHVAIAKPAFAPPGNPDATEIRMTNATGEVVFSGLPNRRGFLAGFKVYPFEADSFDDAYAKAYARIAPTLSVWSMHLDVPLHVFQVDLVELASGNRRIGYVNPAAEYVLAVPPGRDEDTDLEALASIYREAQNSNSLLYQFLCFYKIAEALRRRRDRLAKTAARGGAPYAAPVEVVPSEEERIEPWLGALFPAPPPKDEPFRTIHYEAHLPAESRGKSFEELLGFDRDGRKGALTEVRDLVAHALSSSERGRPFELVNLDDRRFHRRVHIWLPLMKVIARRMLKTDFPGQFLAHLPDPTPLATESSQPASPEPVTSNAEDSMGVKESHEATVLREFASVAALEVDDGSVRNGEPDRGEPDIGCTLTGAPHWFELTRLLAEEVPRATEMATKSLKSGGSGVAGTFVTPWGQVLVERLQAKLANAYQTDGVPVSLVLYYDNEWSKTWEFPPPGDFLEWAKAYLEPEIASAGMGPFAFIWVYDRNSKKVLWSR